MGDYRKLIVWQKSKSLCVEIYKFSMYGELAKDFGMKDQIRRSSLSIASNIAEGEESGYNKTAVRYLNIAKASVAELFTQLIIANEIGYIDDELHKEWEFKCGEISSMLYSLIKVKEKN
jgi:four helix bundle protein